MIAEGQTASPGYAIVALDVVALGALVVVVVHFRPGQLGVKRSYFGHVISPSVGEGLPYVDSLHYGVFSPATGSGAFQRERKLICRGPWVRPFTSTTSYLSLMKAPLISSFV